MAEQVVLLDIRDTAAWITLNRPTAMNALTPGVLAGIDSALDEVAKLPEIRAVVFTGAGRAFSAGADLKFIRESSGGDPRALQNFLQAVYTVLNRVEHFPRPTIAAVNGLALAGGLELTLCCDLVVASESAKLGDAHANFGLIPGGGSSVRLPRKIGPTRAKYLMYTGEFFPARDLVAYGLVNEVVPDTELTSAIEKLVAKLANKSPVGLEKMKYLVDDGLNQPADTALRLELLAFDLHMNSEDVQEGLAAFEQKRTPQFKGR
ncbi:MAG: enoyl-CoA hydratase/isomerase family protein [Candidatus Binatia bacterium]